MKRNKNSASTPDSFAAAKDQDLFYAFGGIREKAEQFLGWTQSSWDLLRGLQVIEDPVEESAASTQFPDTQQMLPG